MSGVCSFLGRNVIDRQHMICGGGCLTQYMRRTADAYSNDADLVNTYWDRIEVRLWWARDSTNIYLTGNAYTEWREPGRDCNNVDQSRVTSNSFAPAWFTWDRTYDYYWDETWLPTMAAPGNFTLYVFTDTPESFGPTLHTEIFLQ
jgi:hypothetical protein